MVKPGPSAPRSPLEFVVNNADYFDWNAFKKAGADHIQYRNPHRDQRLLKVLVKGSLPPAVRRPRLAPTSLTREIEPTSGQLPPRRSTRPE